MAYTALVPLSNKSKEKDRSSTEYSSDATLTEHNTADDEGDYLGDPLNDPLDEDFETPSLLGRKVRWLTSPSSNRKRYFLWAAAAILVIFIAFAAASATRSHSSSQESSKKGSEKHKEKPEDDGSHHATKGPLRLHHDRGQPCTTWKENWEEDWVKSMGNDLTPFIKDKKYSGDTVSLIPQGVKVTILLFYGRREYVDLIDCYLRRNLKVNGGLVDEVVFMMNSQQDEDDDWLPHILTDTPQYRKQEPVGVCATEQHWGCLWNAATDDDTIYIKVDDDIVYMHEDAIPRLIRSRLAYPQAFAISANPVNSFMTPAHWHGGATLPYLPEPSLPAEGGRNATWRASELPDYPEYVPAEGFSNKAALKEYSPPFVGHRWLPLRQNNEPLPDILLTPSATIDGNPVSYTIRQWTIGAQQLYSLLENIEKKTLHRYHVGDGDGIYDFRWKHFNINCIAMWGSDVKLMLPLQEGDEKAITETIPKKLGRPFLIDTKAVIAHLHFQFQNAEMKKTDLLDRFRAYANEMVCPEKKKKRPLAEQCPGFGPSGGEHVSRLV